MAANKKVPLFAFPEELKFCEATRKQILTLYNPYDVSLKFKILCTSPHKYRVVGSQGTLKSHCCIDIVVSLVEIPPPIDGNVDKFRIEIHQGSKLVGYKQISSKFLQSEMTFKSEVCEFKELPLSTKSSEQRQYFSQAGYSNNVLTIFIGIVSLVILLLPLDGESSSWFDWLHVTLNMKLIASFVLGLVTMAILRM